MSTRILIADDHVVIRRMLKALLETHEGWEVWLKGQQDFDVQGNDGTAGKPASASAPSSAPLRDCNSARRAKTTHHTEALKRH